MEEQIDQIYVRVLKFEEDDLEEEKKEQLMGWFRTISNPEASLIDGLVATFIDNTANPELSRKILKVLKKLNEYLPTIVGPQFYNNLKFPQALVAYLEQTQLEAMAGDAFILLINIFDEDTTPDLISVQFVEKLTSSLEFIDDDSTLNSLISILVCLLPVFEKKSEDPDDISKNPILQEFVSKESLYREKLLYITNRGAQYRLDKCCKTLKIILSKPELASYYFNTNDINLIMDVLLREAATNTDSKTRIQVFKLIETVLDNEVYRQYKYRIDDVKEMVNEHILYGDAEKQPEEAELECIAALNSFFQME